MTSPQQRSKQWGYAVEIQARDALRLLFPDIDRTGSSAQKTKGYPDLITPRRVFHDRNPLCLVVTKDKGPGKPLLVTLPVDELITMAQTGVPQTDVYVQVKGRASSTIGSLYRELVAAVKDLVANAPAAPLVAQMEEDQSNVRG